MSWRIDSINTGTGEVTMKHASGRRLALVIPAEHRHDSDRSAEHLRLACAAHEETFPATLADPRASNHTFPWGLLVLAVNTAIIFAILIERYLSLGVP